MGYGVLKIMDGQMTAIAMGSVVMKDDDYGLKLKTIFESTQQLIANYLPDQFAIEAPFFGKNVQSMLKLGRAQGVAMAAALVKGIPIAEYSPRKVKQSITGSGAASKEQVAGMIKTLLNTDVLPKHLDATDGMAVAICHHFQAGRPTKTGASNWQQFIQQNAGRIRG